MFEQVKQLLLDTINTQTSKDKEKKRTRKIIFWYDPKQEYKEQISELKLENTEIILYENNSFWIRYHIEKEEVKKHIVIYLPFEKLKPIDNELLDLESTNKDLIFFPDSITMRLKKLGLTEEYRNIVKKYNKFFNNQKREKEFKEFKLAEKTTQNIDFIITAILLNIKSINDYEILKHIITTYMQDPKKYEELFKFGDETFILDLFHQVFGCKILAANELPEILKSLVLTYFASTIKETSNIEKYRNYLLKEKSTNVYIFINSLMRDKIAKENYNKIAREIEKEFGIQELIQTMQIEDYKTSDAFPCIDQILIKDIINKLIEEIGEYDKYIQQIEEREKRYWYQNYQNEYQFIKIAINFQKKIKEINSLIQTTDINTFVKNYTEVFYEIDTLYRKAYFYFDKMEEKEVVLNLKNKIETQYITDFISKLSAKWIQSIEQEKYYKMVKQNKFYATYIKPFNAKKDRIIVIISDGLRYECAKELTERLKKSYKAKIENMLGIVPSYTKLGMAALLPHKTLARVEESDDILVDGQLANTTKDRQNILQKENPDAIAIKYEDMYEMTKMEWKKLFSGKKVVYLYHNTIDSIGEHNEIKLFQACQSAIEELEKLVRDLHTTFSGVNIFITADHGFFYKRSKIESYEKAFKETKATKQKTRYTYTKEPTTQEGVISLNLEELFGKNSGYVNVPKGNNIYTRQGSNINYVHGGILPQEVIIPVINFKSTRTSEESKKVGITYSGLTAKITNTITYLEFLQDSNVDENHKACRYLLHFEDEKGNRISDECTIIANYQNTEVKDRFFREKFVFKNIEYDRNKSYYLVIIDEETKIELPRVKFYLDIAINNHFEFNSIN